MNVRPRVPDNSFFCAAACTAKVQTASTAPMVKCLSDIFPPASDRCQQVSARISWPYFSTCPFPLQVRPLNIEYVAHLDVDEGLYRPRQGVAIVRRNATSTFFIPGGSRPPGLGYLTKRRSCQPAKHIEQRSIRRDLQIEIHEAVEQDTSTPQQSGERNRPIPS